MRTQFLIALIGSALLAVSLPAIAGDVPMGLEKLQGNWKMVALAVDGKAIVPPPSNQKLAIKGDKFTYTPGSEEHRGVYKVDTEPKVATLDIEFTEGKRKGTTLLAVFEVKGDTLRVCMPSSDPKTRPDAVVSKKGTIVETWKKTK